MLLSKIYKDCLRCAIWERAVRLGFALSLNGGAMDAIQKNFTLARLKTGIDGLDRLLCGGIPENSQMLLLGEAGSGKTLLSFQVAYEAAKAGIHSTYLTIEEKKKSLIEFAEETFTSLSDVQKQIDSGMLRVEEKKLQYVIRSPENIQAIVAEIIRTVEENGSRFLVIDSFSLLRSLYTDDRSFTRGVNYIIESIRNQNVTSLITFENSKQNPNKVPGLLEESMFDGVIKVSRKNNKGRLEYFLNVVKLRYSKFINDECRFEITPSGILVMEESQRKIFEG